MYRNQETTEQHFGQATLAGTLNQRWLGRMPYADALRLQLDCAERLRSFAANSASSDDPSQFGGILLGVEHPVVVTLGIRSNADDLLASEQELSSRGVDICRVRRGGQATAHNPGQLVIYPIVRFDRYTGLGVRTFVQHIQSATEALLADWGLDADRSPLHPGVWVNGRKVASIGIQVSQGISTHGVAINVNNDLKLFESIQPCGLGPNTMTSMTQEAGLKAAGAESIRLELEQLFNQWADHFERLLTPHLTSSYRREPAGSLGAVGSAFP